MTLIYIVTQYVSKVSTVDPVFCHQNIFVFTKNENLLHEITYKIFSFQGK